MTLSINVSDLMLWMFLICRPNWWELRTARVYSDISILDHDIFQAEQIFTL